MVGVISPWNYPLTLSISDAIPAIAAGNAVVMKVDSKTPFSGLIGLELLSQAGLPPDVLQVVTGSGAELGPELIGRVDYGPVVAVSTFAERRRRSAGPTKAASG